MIAAAKPMVRGACPGALRPMESGDGLIVRVRPRAGTLSVAAAMALANAAARFGNGHIDLTRRANLQIRGVTASALFGLQAVIDDLGLLDATPEAEAVRNIIVSPLAGIDPGEVLDVRPIARAIEGQIEDDPALWWLPPKFGFVIDGGGALSLAAERADIRLEAITRDSAAIGIDQPGGTLWLGQGTRDVATRAACRVAMAFLETQPAGSRVRLRDISASVVAQFQSAVSQVTDPIPTSSRGAWRSHASHGRPGSMTPGQSAVETCVGPDLRRDDGDKRASGLDEKPRIGVLRHDGEVFALGLAAPFGRVEAGMLRGLASAVAEQGVSELRVSPWRALYLPVSREEQSTALLRAAGELGFVTEADDPVLSIEACPGAPACHSAALDTREAALTISRLLPRLDGVRRVHVSGCAKGCACSEAADLVLVGGRERFGIVRNGRADGIPEGFIAPHEIERLPALMRAGGGGRRE